jgi:HAD superfamily hydrolase (TIGR01662 family)
LNRDHRPFDAVLFDLGGTLIYFDCETRGVFDRMDAAMFESLQSSFNNLDQERFLQQFNSRQKAYEKERDDGFIQRTTAFIVRQVLQEAGYEQPAPGVIEAALKARYGVSQACWKVEDGVELVLGSLQAAGIPLAIVSNAGDDEDVQTLIDNAHLRPYFKVIVSSAAAGIRKPNPRIFLDVLSRLRVEPGRALMVGDMLEADILGAQNAGLFSVWVTRRASQAANQDHLDTIKPDAVIGSISELPGLLEKLSMRNE